MLNMRWFCDVAHITPESSEDGMAFACTLMQYRESHVEGDERVVQTF